MKNPHAQALGRLGGLAKVAKMTPEQRATMMQNIRLARAIKLKRRAYQRLLGQDQPQ